MPRNAPPAFHILAKPTGAICNLGCKYCFFLSKEMLYPDSRFRMADDLLETYLRQLLESHQAPDVAVVWQGGEPTLMGLEFFKRSVEIVESCLASSAASCPLAAGAPAGGGGVEGVWAVAGADATALAKIIVTTARTTVADHLI